MTPTHGWSLDLTGAKRRIGGILTAALLGSALLVPGSALAYDTTEQYAAAADRIGCTTDYDLDTDTMYVTTQYTGVTSYWNAGYTGAGVDIALIDTGVSVVEGLATPGKIIYGPDLSLESQNPALRNRDTNGHGTFMAGIIAGKDSNLTAPYGAAPASVFRGVAPDARIVSLKVGVADGGVDVSQVIAAIDWVVQHKTDNGLNIRVINLAYGTDSTQAYTIDPLAFAIEQAWKAGIFVVAATGNEGYVFHTGTLTNPAYDPKIFAVGATDSMLTPDTCDDMVALFSSTGSNSRTPDVVNPGAHIVSLRVPGSYIDQTWGWIGQVGERFFRGSGTSEAAAFTSGEAALVIQQRPTITPDQLKKLFLGSAILLNGFSANKQGAGLVSMARMLTLPTVNPPNTWKRIAWSTGTGTLDLARGTDRLTDDGVALSGERDIFGATFNSAAMATLEAAGNSWSGGTWNGNTWSGNTWSGNTWSGNTWSGNSWSGNSWSGNTWSGNTWSGNSWSGNSWSGNSWSGNSWSGNSWSTAGWN